MRTERGPVLVFQHDWDGAGDDALGYAAYGTAEFDRMVFDAGGNPLVKHVVCTSGRGSYFGDGTTCPDGGPRYTVQFSAGLYPILDDVERLNRDEWTWVEGSLTCQDRSQNNRGAYATSSDVNELLCSLFACVVNAQSLVDQVGDERARHCPLDAPEIVSGVIDIDGQPVFVVVGADQSDLINLGGLDPGTSTPTQDLLCVRVRSGHSSWGLPCGHYPAADIEDHTYAVATQLLTSRSTWVFAGEDPTPPPPMVTTHYGACPPPSESFTDTRTDVSPVERWSNQFTPVVPTTVDEEMLLALGPQAREWNRIVAASAPSEVTCAGLAHMEALTTLFQESGLDGIGFIQPPLLMGRGRRAAEVFQLLEGSSTFSREIADRASDPLR